MKLKFEKEQAVSKIGGRIVGGQPGDNPPLMIGNMFWSGDKIVKSRKKGLFDKETATIQIRRLEELEKITGLPSLVDMVANTGDEIKRYIDFFVEATEESRMPFASDAYMTEDRIPAAEHAAYLGQLDRYLYNSFSFWEKSPEKEIEHIARLGVKHVLLALWDEKDDFSTGRVRCLEKMLPMLEPYNFETILCDCTVMGLPTALIGNKSMEIIKEKYGLPAGSGPNNGVSMWLKDSERFGGKEAYRAVDAATESFCSLGADWLMYGPVKGCDRIFPAVAVAQCNLASLVMDEYKELPENPAHPFYLMFPDVVKEFHDKLAGVEKKRKWLRK